MAEALAFSGAKAAVSFACKSLLQEALSYLGTNERQRLENLQTQILPQIELIAEAAAGSPHKARVELWLKELKAAIYEAEDQLDNYKYKLLKMKVKQISRPQMVGDLFSRSTPKFIKESAQCLHDKASLLSIQSLKLHMSLGKLEKIASESKTFLEILNLVPPSKPVTAIEDRRVTAAAPPEKVFGRDKDREHISSLLREPVDATSSYSTLAIVGHGGAGKTTLAQYVCRYEREVKYFDLVMWVHVPLNFELSRLTREMIESASKKECPSIANLDTLQKTLSDMISSKKFLLILDDVWCQNSKDMEDLLAPLKFGLRGSKILITTQIRAAAEASGAKNLIDLEDIEENAFFSLFMHFAVGDAKLENYTQFANIGKQIVAKLDRSPLAARSIGAQLRRNLSTDEWRKVLADGKISGVNEALLWSFQHLDEHLRQCFSYCSIFPKGVKFTRDRLIQHWMAEGYIVLRNQNERIEDVGAGYFNELLSSSFFQRFDEDKQTFYVIHDLLHDLVTQVTENDCLRIESDDQLTEIPSTIHHLSICTSNLSQPTWNTISNLEQLRTLIFIGAGEDVDFSGLNISLANIFENLHKLRVLFLRNCSIKELPESIHNLKHLRFLDISGTPVRALPKSLSKLYHLKVLRMTNCHLDSIPHGMSNLISLRHLDADSTTLSQISDIGRLTAQIVATMGH